MSGIINSTNSTINKTTIDININTTGVDYRR